jgi:hypothetical protein
MIPEIREASWSAPGQPGHRATHSTRNQIAHRGGICTKEEAKKLEAPLRKVRGLRLERDVEGFRVDLNLDSCRYMVSTIKLFFEQAGRKAGFRNGG